MVSYNDTPLQYKFSYFDKVCHVAWRRERREASRDDRDGCAYEDYSSVFIVYQIYLSSFWLSAVNQNQRNHPGKSDIGQSSELVKLIRLS